MVRMRGVNIYLWHASRPSAAMNVPTGEWLCVAERSESGASSEKSHHPHRGQEERGIAAKGMVEHMERRLKEDLGVRVNVELVDEGTLTEFTNFGREGKARRLLDLRRKT